MFAENFSSNDSTTCINNTILKAKKEKEEFDDVYMQFTSIVK